MSALLAALLLAAAPPSPAQKAKELTARKAWEELYLAFSSGDASGVPETQRRAVSSALQKGCEALLQEDTVMAYSLGERAVVYEESAGALKCLAHSARKTDQRASAEAALRKGMQRHPKDGAFALELAKLLMEEQDAAGALAVLETVPARAKEASEARRLMQQARSQRTMEGAARMEAARIEQKLNGPPGKDTEAVPALAIGSRVDARPTGLAFQSGVDENGMRTRTNSRFAISYFNNNRDFGQRADYEGSIVEALDDAYHTARELLGQARESPVKVILYTRAEYRSAFGSRADTIAGTYRNRAMRINDAVKMTPANKATIVHEYIHAVMAEICGDEDRDVLRLPIWFHEGVAKYVEWRYLRQDGPEPALMAELRGIESLGQLPTLARLSEVPLVNTPNPYASYAVAAMAIREMVRQSGMHRLVPFARDVCVERQSFDSALLEHFGKTLQDLDREVRAALPAR